jgi:hypothetical protein
LRSRLLQNDSELPFVVETPQIRVERLRLANHRLLTGKSMSEGPEAPVGIDVIHDECSVWSRGRPRPIQFKAYVAFTVKAVVNEKINLAQVGKQMGKATPAGTFDV